MTVRRVADLDFAAVTAGPITPSPSAWEDEVLYFLLVDRFSDGNEDGYLDLAGQPRRGQHPRCSSHPTRAMRSPLRPDAAGWRQAGLDRAGGTLDGLRSKLGYLRRLGITALWISPVLKQAIHPRRAEQLSRLRHPGFPVGRTGLRQQRRIARLVADAHAVGLRVVLDVVLNHTGDVFGVRPVRHRSVPGDRRFTDRPGRSALGRRGLPGGRLAVGIRRAGAFHPARGSRVVAGRGGLPGRTASAPDVLAQGRITNWDNPPEFLEGRFRPV